MAVSRGFVVVLKVSAECNLRCTYCYEYAGSTGRVVSRGTKRMARGVAAALLTRICEHQQQHASDTFELAFHGGEPLLWGLGNIEWFLETAGGMGLKNVSFSVQTNGVVLTPRHLDVFRRYGVRVGISSDGPGAYQQRRIVKGSGEVATGVDRAIRLMVGEAPDIFGGVLVVPDLQTDPRPILDYFVDVGVRTCDFLLPMATRQLALEDIRQINAAASLYYQRLLTHWIRLGFSTISVRILLELARHSTTTRPGERSGARLDSLGGNLAQVFTLEPDGTLMDVDVNRVTGAARADGRSIFSIGFDEFQEILAVSPIDVPSPVCQECKHYAMCGGGYAPHRFDGSSFANPSVYCGTLYGICEDLQRLAA